MRFFFSYLSVAAIALTLLSANANAQTTAPAQAIGLNGFKSEPLFTIGETLNGYQPVGILDGLGALKLDNGNVRVLANHELVSNRGYEYQLANGVTLRGARVSYFDINPTTFKVVDAGLAYDRAFDREGKLVTSSTQINEGTNPTSTDGYDRFCSASLFEAGKYGLQDNIFFTGEETSNGIEYALDPATKTIYALPWLGRAAWENVTLLETGNANKVAILIGDDTPGAPLYLYIGDKNAKNDGSFLDRNGLAQGKLYVWAADNGDLTPEQFKGTGTSRTGTFKEIAFYQPAQAGQTGFDALGFATQNKQYELSKAVGGFTFARPEDVATNPANGRQAVLASTGRGQLFPSDDWGTTYIIDFDFADLQAVKATVKIVYGGDDAGAGKVAGPDFGIRSADNLDWADNGMIYIQEDRSTANNVFGGRSKFEASIWELNPTTGNIIRIGVVDRTAVPAGQSDSNVNDFGNWETSGILDVTSLFPNNKNELILIADVQAHSLVGGPITANGLMEGGQLFLLRGPLTAKQTTSQVQIVHNSPKENVDVYVNGNLALDNFVFRTATPNIDLPAELVSIAVAPANSQSVADAVYTVSVILSSDKAYWAVANGIVGGTPAFGINLYDQKRDNANGLGNVGVLFVHGAPDAPAVDILAGTNILFDNVEFGKFAGYADVPANVQYELNVTPANDNNTSVGTYLADFSFWRGRTALVFASGLLNGQPGFEPWVALSNGGTYPLPRVKGPSNVARLQVIHNAPSPTVDVYANGVRLLNDFVFQTATPFIDVPAGVDITLAVAPGTSATAAEAVASFPVKFEAGKTYIAVANGLVGGTPGFTLSVFDKGLEKANDPKNVALLFFHGALNAPEVDIVTGGAPLFDNVSFGNFSTGYVQVPANASYELSVTPSNDNSTVVAKYLANLGFWAGNSAVVFASGYLSGGSPAFQPWVALSSGGTFPLSAISTAEARNYVAGNFALAPNPASDAALLSAVFTEEATANVRIFDAAGRAVRTLDFGTVSAGIQQFRLDLSGIQSGMYFVQVRTGSSVETLPLVVR